MRRIGQGRYPHTHLQKQTALLRNLLLYFLFAISYTTHTNRHHILPPPILLPLTLLPRILQSLPLKSRMKHARQNVSGKRLRTTSGSAEDEDAHTDDDIRADESATRPAQAERKRELERNRRNLVNVRFLELEAEIRRCAPRVESPAAAAKSEPTTKCRRIDKEAVLKEAAQRLAVQRKEIATFAERICNMTNEIDNLRAEKVELRSDKAYLRDELDTIRGDVHRLRSDNIQLWQALKKQSSVKNILAPDVAKIPAELFLRTKNQEQSSALPMSNGAAVGNAGTALAALSRQSVGYQSPSLSSHPSVHNPAQETSDVNRSPRNLNGDAYLVFQSPEELGELFNSYVPGSVTGFDNRGVPGIPTSQSEHRQSSNEATENTMVQGLAAVAQLAASQSGFTYDRPPPNAQLTDGEKQEEDPFSDIAHCP